MQLSALTGPGYTDPEFLARAEQVRSLLYQHTGRVFDDDQLLAYMAETEQDPRWRGES